MPRSLWLILAVVIAATLAGCGGSNNAGTVNNGLFGDWNVVMYPTDSSNPSFVFALAMSQEGSSNYSGGSIAYTGSVAVPGSMCINAKTLTATASVSGSEFTMTVTDSTTGTSIVVNGPIASTNGDLTGTYNNSQNEFCSATQGSVTMTPQG